VIQPEVEISDHSYFSVLTSELWLYCYTMSALLMSLDFFVLYNEMYGL
jgi:hypothetical protein